MTINIQAYNKAIVALVMAIIGIVNLVWQFPVPIDEAVVSGIVALATPLLVYLVPNKK